VEYTRIPVLSAVFALSLVDAHTQLSYSYDDGIAFVIHSKHIGYVQMMIESKFYFSRIDRNERLIGAKSLQHTSDVKSVSLGSELHVLLYLFALVC